MSLKTARALHVYQQNDQFDIWSMANSPFKFSAALYVLPRVSKATLNREIFLDDFGVM